MPTQERQEAHDQQPDTSPAAHAPDLQSSRDRLLDVLREVNSFGTAPNGPDQPVSAAFKAGKPAAPDGITAGKNSYLDVAIHAVVDPLTRDLGGSQAACNEITFYSKSFLKTAPLFMNGRAALASLALLYVADEAKPHESYSAQAADAAMGLGKGLLLAGSFAAMRQRNFTPSLTALGLGVSNRAIETGLTRTNYYDSQGHLNIGKGLLETGKTTFNPVSLAIDGTSLFLADGLWGRIYSRSRGAVRFDPLITHAIAAGTYGATTGMESEAYRQWKAGKLDLALLVRRTAEQGTVNLLAGSLGGLQTRGAQRLESIDATGAIDKARATPYQRGESGIDARQAALRNGQFVTEKEGANLTTTTLFGHIKTTEGEIIPAVFRPHTGTEAFAHRMQSEIANYDLNKMIGYDNKSPATVAATVDIAGKPTEGYVQELRGQSLLKALKDTAQQTQGATTRQALVKALNENPSLKTAYQESWVERMVMGEWDNHAQNQTVVKSPGKVEVSNIDLGDGLRPVQSTKDLLPTPALRTGWEGLNWRLYKELAGKPIPEQTRQKLADFVKSSQTESGQSRLRAMGLTDQQTKGVVARSKWFAEQGVFPSEPETLVYFSLAFVKNKIIGRKP